VRDLPVVGAEATHRELEDEIAWSPAPDLQARPVGTALVVPSGFLRSPPARCAAALEALVDGDQGFDV
jgi:hypothetical protein